MGLVRGQLRSDSAGRVTLIAGISSAAAAFTLLCMNASALTVQVSGRLPGASPRRAYDILVRLPSRVTQQADAGSPARPADLAELSGGMTLTQYDTISRLPGVAVAAPMTMIGYVPLTIVIPVVVPASALTSTPALFTVTAQQRSDDGLTSITERNAGMTYVTAGQTVPAACAAAELAVSSASSRLATCWSTTTGPQLKTWAGPQPSAVSVPLAWTFQLPLVAVDPQAEARLLHLDGAVVHGSYLPATATRSGEVPVIVAGSIDDDAQDEISLARLPASAARSYADGLTAQQVRTLLGVATEQTVATSTVTATQAYADLVAYLRGSAAVRVPVYRTPSPAHFVAGADGSLSPQPVQSDAGFRALTLHTARSASGSGGNGPGSGAGAALHAVGVFDPARIASSSATPSPYLGERLSGADATSRLLLRGGTLEPDGDPAGYPSPGATLVMPLQDIGAFTAASAYTHTDAAAPIGSIRVRVTDATGDGAVSQARIRMVAQEIVRATGLQVDVTLAASAATPTIDLAAGRDGRPALRLREIWYRSDTRTTVSAAVDPQSVALSGAVLLAGSAFAASGSRATLRRRRRELATLRALGWRRWHVAWQLVREFANISATAGIFAVLLAYTLDAAISRSAPATGWPLLSAPAAAVMTVAAAWWQVRRATAEPASATGALEAPAVRRARTTGTFGHTVRNLLRAPRRSALSGVVITGACAALGLELTVQWVFGGAVVGSWLGKPFSWQDDPVDLAAVLTIVALATVTMMDVSRSHADERAVELRTLRALGWPAHGVAWLAVTEAALLGLAGGVAACVLDVIGILAVVHRAPLGLLPVGGVVAGTGAGITLVAAAASAVARAHRRTRRLTSDDGVMTSR